MYRVAQTSARPVAGAIPTLEYIPIKVKINIKDDDQQIIDNVCNIYISCIEGQGHHMKCLLKIFSVNFQAKIETTNLP